MLLEPDGAPAVFYHSLRADEWHMTALDTAVAALNNMNAGVQS